MVLSLENDLVQAKSLSEIAGQINNFLRLPESLATRILYATINSK